MATPVDNEDTPMPDVDAAADATSAAGHEVAEEQKLSPELYDAMAAMLEALYEYRDEEGHDPSKLFHKRPNKRNVPGYYDVIKEPMAMSSLRAKISGKQYHAFAEFVRDCALIWHNAFEFNRPDSIAYEDATVIKGVMETEIKKIVDQELATSLEAEWPDLGDIPPVDEDGEGADEEEAESGDEDEDDEEGGDNSEAEANKPRRRGRRPSAPKRSESQAEGSSKRRGRPPKVDTPLEARIKNVLKAIRKPKHANGSPMIFDFEKLPDKALYPEYYSTIKSPLSLEQIKRNMKRKRYRTVDDCVAGLDQMFGNAIQFNEENSLVYNAAVKLKAVAHQTAEEEKQKPDEAFSHEEGRKPKPGGISHNGQLWKVGDWVHIQNPNDATKPIIAQLYRTWEDENGQDWVNACWYYRPEQTVHHFEKHFLPNEVLKTSQYRDHRIDEVIDKCFVMFYTRFHRGRPRGLPEGTEVYVCEARYNEEKHKINKIKTWSSCLPDEVRDHDYEMDLFDQQRRIKKLPTPLEHLIKTAKDPSTAPLPQPKMGVEDAPPIEGGIYLGARDENQSPPPSPTPSPPAPAPVQPVRPPSSTPARDSPSKHPRNDVDTAMADATRAFGVGGASRPQTNFVGQRQSSVSGANTHAGPHTGPFPGPHASQYSYGGAYGGSGQGGSQSSQRPSYDSAASPSLNRTSSTPQPIRAGATGVTANGPMRLPEHLDRAIPAAAKKVLHTDDDGFVLFFPDAPLRYTDGTDPEKSIPSHMRTSIRYRAGKIRERLLAQKRAREAEETNNKTDVAVDVDTAQQTSDVTTESSTGKANGTDVHNADELWKTNPITQEELTMVDPEDILKIDSRRIYPSDESWARAATGMSFLQWAAGMQAGTQAAFKSACDDKEDWKEVMRARLSRLRKQQDRLRAQIQEKEHRETQKRIIQDRDVFKEPDFYIDDIDPLYVGSRWTGPNPYGPRP